MSTSGVACSAKKATTGAACTKLPEQSPSSARYSRTVHDAHAVMLAMASASWRPPVVVKYDV